MKHFVYFSWKENVPQMFEDACLYSQVIGQMSLYNYKLSMRRFIQGFFEPVKFTQVGKRVSNFAVSIMDSGFPYIVR